jgi:hypothetical protein
VAKFGQMQEFNERVEFALREAANFIKANGRLPIGMGFVLLMFDFGENGNMFYISDAQRDDVLKAMQEFIDKNS